jgi:hypothetical protein
MTRLAIIALVPLFSGFLMAQDTETQATSTETTYTGTLMDAGCVSKHTENTETTNTPDSTTTTHTTTKEMTNCPVTSDTSSFVLETPDHQYIHFDPASQTQIVEKVKGNKEWVRYMQGHEPIRVTVVGQKRDGDVVVVKTIQ